jgi:DNA-binding transcriptional MocR family regulator
MKFATLRTERTHPSGDLHKPFRNGANQVMTRSTSTLSQSGLLAVLLQRQRYKVSQLAWRRAHRKHVRAAFWSTLTWLRRALRAHEKSVAVMNCPCAGCRAYWQSL